VKERNLPRVDFIKADIEGAECAMLLGAAETIRKYRPKMALCIYHRDSTDHWLVPETLLSICRNYRFHLKHYIDNRLTDVVLFCEPTDETIERIFDRERLRPFSELYEIKGSVSFIFPSVGMARKINNPAPRARGIRKGVTAVGFHELVLDYEHIFRQLPNLPPPPPWPHNLGIALVVI
jgi:hypothetical protein